MTHCLFRITYCAIIRMRHRKYFIERDSCGNVLTIGSGEQHARVFGDSTLAYVHTINVGYAYFADSVSARARVTTTPLSYAVRGV